MLVQCKLLIIGHGSLGIIVNIWKRWDEVESRLHIVMMIKIITTTTTTTITTTTITTTTITTTTIMMLVTTMYGLLILCSHIHSPLTHHDAQTVTVILTVMHFIHNIKQQPQQQQQQQQQQQDKTVTFERSNKGS